MTPALAEFRPTLNHSRRIRRWRERSRERTHGILPCRARLPRDRPAEPPRALRRQEESPSLVSPGTGGTGGLRQSRALLVSRARRSLLLLAKLLFLTMFVRGCFPALFPAICRLLAVQLVPF